jgi:hypothetical protein
MRRCMSVAGWKLPVRRRGLTLWALHQEAKNDSASAIGISGGEGPKSYSLKRPPSFRQNLSRAPRKLGQTGPARVGYEPTSLRLTDPHFYDDKAQQRGPNEPIDRCQRPAEWDQLKALVLDSVSSPISKRVYNMALDEFLAWFDQAPWPWHAMLAGRNVRPSGLSDVQSSSRHTRTTPDDLPVIVASMRLWLYYPVR